MIAFRLSDGARKSLEKLRLAPKLIEAKEKEIREAAAKDVAEAVREAIEKQLFPMVPLTKQYASRKAAKGLDQRILMATKKYFDSIKAVGGAVAADESLYNILENGTKKQPPRPHWGPAIERTSFKAVRQIAEEVIRALSGS